MMRGKRLAFDAAIDHLVELVSRQKRLLLISHSHPDGDCIGSAFALKYLISALGGEAYVACADRLPSRLGFMLIGQDSTALEDAPHSYGDAPAIALDIAAPAQLGDFETCFGPQKAHRILLSFDHHERFTPIAERYYSDPQASATGEIIWDVAKSLLLRGLIADIPNETAVSAYAAISSDTGCFRDSNVTAKTHLIASEIIGRAHDPEHTEIDRLLFDSKSEERLRAERAGLEKLRLLAGGKVAVCPITYEEMINEKLPPEELEALIDVARSVMGVEIAFSIRGQADGKYRISSRSNCDFDVSKLCMHFGGGGHIKAAGCTLEAENIEQVISMLMEMTPYKNKM